MFKTTEKQTKYYWGGWGENVKSKKRRKEKKKLPREKYKGPIIKISMCLEKTVIQIILQVFNSSGFLYCLWS